MIATLSKQYDRFFTPWHFLLKENVLRIMIFLDFRKAFDSVECYFILGCLVFNFRFIFYYDARSIMRNAIMIYWDQTYFFFLITGV